MSVLHSNENLHQLQNMTSACGLCKEEVSENNLLVTPCQHNFHRLCISGWLNENESCPICHRGLDTQSIKSFAEQEQVEGFANQGARPKENPPGVLTRSRNQNNSFNANLNRSRGRGRQNNNTNGANRSQIQSIIQENLHNFEDQFSRQIHGEIGRLVSESLDAYFQNLRVTETRNLVQVADRMNRSNVNNVNNADASNQDPNVLHSSGRFREDSGMISQSVSSKIISGWKLSFDGSLTSVPVDEFIYRVNALTNTTLRGDYHSLCQNVHILFEGKAKRWFWRYHHSVRELDWVDICEDLRKNFKDFRTDFEIKESIRNLKQKSGESFENYLDHILSTADSLKHPLSDREMVEIVLRNLQPEIRLELLHLELNSISDLRKACRRRENLVAEMQSKPQFQKLNNQFRRNVSEVDIEEEGAFKEEIIAGVTTNGASAERKCWNCDGIGHNYKNCVKPRRVFCYGCGLVAFFLPNCPKCNNPENAIRDVSNKLRHPSKKSDPKE
ncbi:uncharacterized protein LOC118755957 [Rhagoletis pomonella]|uniref:uncharacterized protein LOC118755957 n=1 Tax=Rhagoletis pomonella TaxID=28610 RepID=UPI001783AB15|nr:uncharacterized protein LOC118755957 [Rhagoletis pomonella]